jgi:curved DNA-binding protein CbpA
MPESNAFSQRLTIHLLELHRTQRGGIVRAERGTTKKQLVVRNGRLAFAESNSPEDHLARVLVSMELLPRKALAGIAALMREKKTSDEAILATSKLGLRELEEGAREQARMILASLMEWESGDLRIYASEQLARRQYDLGMPLHELLVDAARRAAAKRPMPAAFSPLKGIVFPAVENREDLLTLPLDKDEAYAFSTIEGPARLENILPLLGAESSKPEELILRLLMLGLIGKGALAAESVPEVAPVDAGDEQEQRLDEMIRRFERANSYGILGLSPDAGELQIKEAYHWLAKKYHPDRFQSKEHSSGLRAKAEKLFTLITGAYSKLEDQALRAAYDRELQRKGSTIEGSKRESSGGEGDRETMAEAAFQVGRGLFLKGEFKEAAEKLKECVWLKPEVAKYRYYLGASQAENPRMRKEAEQNLMKAIELDQSNSDSYLALGKLYLTAGLARRAEAQFHSALRLNPQNAEAERLLGEISAGGANPR